MLWVGSAFVVGLAGSFHCVGMCGPIALALPGGNQLNGRFVLSRTLYHLGRTVSYSLLGLIIGLFGEGIALAGWQQGLSIALGITLLLMLVAQRWESHLLQLPLIKPAFQWLRRTLGQALQNDRLPTVFNVGILNGFLPCGFVYLALTGALATTDVWQSVGFMALFGLGTIPAMLGISLAKAFLPQAQMRKLQPVLQVLAVAVTLLLIIRGLNLGIPYLSPEVSVGVGEVVECH